MSILTFFVHACLTKVLLGRIRIWELLQLEVNYGPFYGNEMKLNKMIFLYYCGYLVTSGALCEVSNQLVYSREIQQWFVLINNGISIAIWKHNRKGTGRTRLVSWEWAEFPHTLSPLFFKCVSVVEKRKQYCLKDEKVISSMMAEVTIPVKTHT